MKYPLLWRRDVGGVGVERKTGGACVVEIII